MKVILRAPCLQTDKADPEPSVCVSTLVLERLDGPVSRQRYKIEIPIGIRIRDTQRDDRRTDLPYLALQPSALSVVPGYV